MDKELSRRIAQGVLAAVSIAAAAGAFVRYQSSRPLPGARPTPSGKAVFATPSAGPVGVRPFLELFGWKRGEQVRVLFCRTGMPPADCADLGTATMPARGFQARAIPAELGGAVTPGEYILRADPPGEAVPRDRGRFTVVPFQMGQPPRARSYADTAVSGVQLSRARQVARNAPCTTRYTPDDRLVLGSSLLDPRTGVTIELRVAGAELAWSKGPRSRLAVITDDRKEIRVAAADGSGPEAVVREARGFLSSISWSSDGGKLAYVARPQAGVSGGPRAGVWVVDLLDGSKKHAGPGEAVAWSPSVERFAVETSDRGARSIALGDPNGGRQRLTDGRSPSWSPDGALLVFLRGTGETGPVFVSRTDRVEPRQIHAGPACAAAFSADGSKVALVLTEDGTRSLHVASVRSS